jgi:hypothetical protein
MTEPGNTDSQHKLNLILLITKIDMVLLFKGIVAWSKSVEVWKCTQACHFSLGC